MFALASYSLMILMLPILSIGFLLPIFVFCGMPFYFSGTAACGYWLRSARERERIGGFEEAMAFSADDLTGIPDSYPAAYTENVIFLHHKNTGFYAETYDGLDVEVPLSAAKTERLPGRRAAT